MKCWYDGILHLRKGDLLEISKGYEEEYGGFMLRVNALTMLSTMAQHNSSFDTNKLPGPITGRVIRSIVKHETKTTFFEIEEGNFPDHVFTKAGEHKKGQDALKEIFTSRIDEYVKIWDPYISADSIKLVSNVGNSITIDILTQSKDEIDEVKEEANKLSNRIIIKKGLKFHDHDRFILTKGEGWSVGHSLKDFGKKNSLLAKLPISSEIEMAFDDNWNESEEIIFEKE